MDPQRWHAIRSAFDALVEMQPHDRAERLSAIGAVDPELRRRVENLLEADAEAERRLVGRMFGASPPIPTPEHPRPLGRPYDPLCLTGHTISHFRILEPIGSGGMGVVYSAEDTRLNRLVAIKLPLPEYRLDAVARDRFLHEARSAAGLSHPNLCGIHEVGESDDGLPFIAMELYQGETLKARLARDGSLPITEVIGVGRQIAQGLAAAHQAGIVHRDLKPGNLMLLPDGTVKVLDFGLAKVRDLSLTGSKGLLGTPAYMAPEQICGERVDGRADLWALGVLLYETLTGRQPFQGEHEVAIAHAVVHEDPRRPVELRGEIPGALEDVVLTLLEKRSEHRYATPQEVDAELAGVQLGRPGRGRRWPWTRSVRRRRAALGAAAGLVLFFVAAVGHLSLRPEAAPIEPNLLAVAPFDVPDTSLQLWREGLVDVLSLDLDGAGPLRTVPQTVVLRRWSGRADRASAARLGARTGAELVVFGHLVRIGSDSVALRAAVLERSSGATLQDLGIVGEEGRMGQLAESLGVHILRAIGRGRPIGAVREVTLGARSVPALKEFLRGEQFYRRNLWDSAAAHYDQALTHDGDFVLALRRMANAVEWPGVALSRFEPGVEYRRRAIALNRGLSPRDSLLLVSDSFGLAVEASDSPHVFLRNLYRAMGAVEEAVRRYPDDPNIWYELGERRYHSAPPLGGSPQQALEAFERSIALDPGFGPAYVHAVELALQLRGPVKAAEYARIGAALAAGYAASSLRITALVLDSGIASPAVARALSAASGSTLLLASEQLRWAADPEEASVAVLRALQHGRFDQEDAGALVTDSLLRARVLAWALAFRGRLRAAAALGSAPHPRFVNYAFDPFPELALFGAVPGSVSQRIFGSALEPGADWGTPSTFAAPRQLQGVPWWFARGDTAELARFATRAGRATLEKGPFAPLRGRYFQAVALAYIALAAGDSSRAVDLLHAIPDTLCIVGRCFHEKLTLARILAARGDPGQAAALLDRWGTVPASVTAPGNTPSAVLAALERGRIAERLADTLTALGRYRFVAEIWRHADPELQHYVAEAGAAIARLSGSPARTRMSSGTPPPDPPDRAAPPRAGSHTQGGRAVW